MGDGWAMRRRWMAGLVLLLFLAGAMMGSTQAVILLAVSALLFVPS